LKFLNYVHNQREKYLLSSLAAAIDATLEGHEGEGPQHCVAQDEAAHSQVAEGGSSWGRTAPTTAATPAALFAATASAGPRRAVGRGRGRWRGRPPIVVLVLGVGARGHRPPDGGHAACVLHHLASALQVEVVIAMWRRRGGSRHTGGLIFAETKQKKYVRQ